MTREACCTRRSTSSSPPRAAPGRAPRQPGHLLAEGVHPAHDAVPRPLRLLHLRQAAGPPRPAVPRRSTRCSRSPARGAALGCHEALFTLGEAPEDRYPRRRRVARRARLRVDRRLPRRRVPARCSTRPACSPTPTPARSREAELVRLRAVSPSQGMMIETLADRLDEPGGPHFGAPDKTAARRLATLEAAGRGAGPVHHRHPRRHRRDAEPSGSTRSLAIRDAHARHGHVQEVIVQNFLPKPGTVDARARRRARPTSSSGRSPSPAWCSAPRCTCRRRRTSPTPTTSRAGRRRASTTGAASRRSPPDHVNPERPWPALDAAARRDRGRRARRSRRASPSTPSTCATPTAGSHPDVRFAVLVRVRPRRPRPRRRLVPRAATSRRRALLPPPLPPAGRARPHAGRRGARRRARRRRGRRRRDRHAARRPRSRGRARSPRSPTSCARDIVGDDGHVRPQPQHQLHERLHVQVPVLRVLEGPALAQPARRPVPPRARGDAAPRGRGGRVRRDRGVPPGRDPPRLRRRLLPRRRAGGEGGRARDPRARLHRARGHRGRAPARHAARATTCVLAKEAGLATLPGTAAEILDDEVRAIICPDKINTEEWLDAHRTAHSVGLRSNVTIMFGTVERPEHVARHLVRTRALQKETGGFTEFVPLPFVHMATPIFLQGKARRGPDVPRGAADARGRPHRVPRLDRQRPGVVGEDRRRRRPAGAAGRVQRPRRHADGREHLARRRREPRPGARRVEFRAIVEPLGRPLEQRTTLYGRTNTVGRRLRPPPERDRGRPRRGRGASVRRRPVGAGRRQPVTDASRSTHVTERAEPTRRRRHRQRARRRAQPRDRRVRRRRTGSAKGAMDAHRHRRAPRRSTRRWARRSRSRAGRRRTRSSASRRSAARPRSSAGSPTTSSARSSATTSAPRACEFDAPPAADG